MHLFSFMVLSLVLCASDAVNYDWPDPPSPEPTEVMIVGVFHFTNEPIADVLSEKRQAEIADVVDRLAAFKPTKVFVEQQPYFKQKEFDITYPEYRNGKYVLGANEVFQLGFRLAAKCGHERIWCTDHAGFWKGREVRESAEKHGQVKILDGESPSTFKMPYELLSSDKVLPTVTIGEYLCHLNDPKIITWSHNWYIDRAIRIGTAEDLSGGDLVAHWYRRNLMIYRLMLSLIDPGDERVVLIIGSGHLQILRQLFTENLNFRLIEPNKYLVETPMGE